MIIKKENNILKKYDVSINIDALESLKYKIISECSTIRHIEQKMCEDDIPFEGDKVFNLTKKFINSQANRNFFGPTFIDVYEVSYDYYIYPEIIDIIDGVLKENSSMTLKLLNYSTDHKSEKEIVKEKINLLLKDDELLNDFNKQYELKRLIEEYNNTKCGKSINKYLDEVKNCITLNLIDELSEEEYDKACSFFCLDKDNFINDELPKLVYKNN